MPIQIELQLYFALINRIITTTVNSLKYFDFFNANPTTLKCLLYSIIN